ncbi:HisA/HisF-related TIM barrel protein, partial [Frankia sp. Cpl3]|nr:HisA/HisF-related TIM barrel protein [Frankia sp. Cpl3]
FTQKMLGMYGEKAAIGLDCRRGYVATRGWLTTTDVKAEALANELAGYGAETFIYTDISRDGTLTGPNVEEIVALARATGKQVIASGGVSVPEDLLSLSRYAAEGVAGAIVGKALYTGAVDLKAAMKRVGEVV